MSKSTGVWGGLLIDRMQGAARLNSNVYREIVNDGRATGQALVVVALVSTARVVGAMLGGEDIHLVIALIVGLVDGVLNWVMWALFIWLFGVTLLKMENTNAGWGQMVRATGFAQTPGLLSVIGFIPDITFLIAGGDIRVDFCMHGGRRPAEPGLHVNDARGFRNSARFHPGGRREIRHTMIPLGSTRGDRPLPPPAALGPTVRLLAVI